MIVSRSFDTAKRWLCRIGIHWNRERKTYVSAPGLSECRCLLCGKEWRDIVW